MLVKFLTMSIVWSTQKLLIVPDFAYANMKPSNIFTSKKLSNFVRNTDWRFHAFFYWKSLHSTWTFHSMEYLSSLLFASFLLFEMCRLTGTEETVRAATKRLTQGMADFNKAISSAKTEEEKTKIVSLWFSRLKNIMDRQSVFKNHVLIPANWLWCECFFAEKRSTDCNKDNAVI